MLIPGELAEGGVESIWQILAQGNFRAILLMQAESDIKITCVYYVHNDYY